MKKILSYTLLAALLLTACEKQIPIDIDEMEPIVVVHSFNSDTANVSLRITKSRPVFGYHDANEGYINSDFPKVTNATATLTVNGTGYPALRDDNLYTFAYTPREGDRLQLHVEVPGADPLTAETVVPRRARLGDVTVSHEAIDQWSDGLFVSIPIIDPVDEENFYLFQVRRVVYYYPQFDAEGHVVSFEDGDSSLVYFQCDDPIVVDHDLSTVFEDDPGTMPSFRGNTLLVDDSRLNGLSHTLKLKVPYDGYANENLYIEYQLHVLSLSREEFYYRQSAQGSWGDLEEVTSLFSEPKQIFSNIEGGAGVFGAHVGRVITLDISGQ